MKLTVLFIIVGCLGLGCTASQQYRLGYKSGKKDSQKNVIKVWVVGYNDANN